SHEKHKSVDDTPVGGGPGMVMAADPAFGALESVGAEDKRVIYMSPRGEKLSPDKVRELSEEDDIVILCGHYEGVDQRILDYWDAEEISIGDYVLTGGELPAMVLIDAVSRLVPGVLSSVDAATEESVYSGLLEYPQYTRPADYKGLKVPEVLLSGDHKKVDLWRFEQSLILTKKRRPDLFDRFVKNHRKLTKEEYKIMEKVSLLL
ncbi:MAG: tRNA (guanosine(37)-N1)-methyltransferase TrmD, partial [Anaerovoracaceae bacterium]